MFNFPKKYEWILSKVNGYQFEIWEKGCDPFTPIAELEAKTPKVIAGKILKLSEKLKNENI